MNRDPSSLLNFLFKLQNLSGFLCHYRQMLRATAPIHLSSIRQTPKHSVLFQNMPTNWSKAGFVSMSPLNLRNFSILKKQNLEDSVGFRVRKVAQEVENETKFPESSLLAFVMLNSPFYVLMGIPLLEQFGTLPTIIHENVFSFLTSYCSMQELLLVFFNFGVEAFDFLK